MPSLDSLGVEVMLSGEHPSLWRVAEKREVLRFLRKAASKLSKRNLNRVVNAILKGPPSSLYDDEQYRLGMIRERLSKIVESGTNLPPKARRLLADLGGALPPNEDHSEEFSSYIRVGWVSSDEVSVDGDVKRVKDMSADEFLLWLDELSSDENVRVWDAVPSWQEFFQKSPREAQRKLALAAKNMKWPARLWYTALDRNIRKEGVSKSVENDLLRLLLVMPNVELGPLTLQASGWLENEWKKLDRNRSRDFWVKLWHATIADDLNGNDLSDPDFDMSHNHAGGVLANVAYSDLAIMIPTVAAGEGSGIPSELSPLFELISRGNHLGAKVGRVRLAPMLFILYRIDPGWTQECLLSRMDLDQGDAFEPFIWEGFLWGPRVSPDLIAVFKPLFLKVLQNLGRIPEDVRDNALQLLIYMAIPSDRGVSGQEAKAALSRLNARQLAVVGGALKSVVEAAGNRANKLWEETVGPWFAEVWPKTHQMKSPELSEELVELALASGNSFPKVVRAVETFLTPERYGVVVHRFEEVDRKSGITADYPDEAFVLVQALEGGGHGPIDAKSAELLSRIEKSKPRMRQSARFRAMVARSP